jgi:heme exporter protein D
MSDRAYLWLALGITVLAGIVGVLLALWAGGVL